MSKFLFAGLILALVFAVTTLAGDFDLSWFNVASGGGGGAGGEFEIAGTLGQSDSQTMAGGGFSLAGGFWPGAASDSGAPCPGDIDADGDVDITDLSALLSQFGVTGPGNSADLDGDGDVDIGDLSLLLSNFGIVC